MPRQLIIAHRGHNTAFPEQTLMAFRAAVELGADMIEADVRITNDGVPILMHDRDVRRTTSSVGEVSELTWAEISKLDAGSWFDPAFRDARVPRLDDLFELADSTGIALCLEAKGSRPGEAAANAQVAAREIARRGRLDKDVVASFEHSALREAVAFVAGLRTAPDRLPERGQSTAKTLIEQARTARASIIQHHFQDLTDAVVQEVQAAGIEIWAWPTLTVGDVEIAVRTGAIGIMGDDVANIASVLRR